MQSEDFTNRSNFSIKHLAKTKKQSKYYAFRHVQSRKEPANDENAISGWNIENQFYPRGKAVVMSQDSDLVDSEFQ